MDNAKAIGEAVGDKVEFLGSGLYASAFRSLTNRKRVYIAEKEGGQSKSILREAKRLRNNKHLPDLTFIGEYVDNYMSWDGSIRRTMTYKLWETTYSESLSDATLPDTITSLKYGFVKREEVTTDCGSLKVPQSVKEALEDIFSACETYGMETEYLPWDLHGGNFAIDPETKEVILRDPLAC